MPKRTKKFPLYFKGTDDQFDKIEELDNKITSAESVEEKLKTLTEIIRLYHYSIGDHKNVQRFLRTTAIIRRE